MAGEHTSPQYLFHGGCHGCTQQEINGVEFCLGCQYFDADWSLPNLNNREPNKTEKMREFLKMTKSIYGNNRQTGTSK